MTSPTGSRIEQVAHSILARSEFRHHGRSLLQRAGDAVFRWMDKVFSGLVSSMGGGGIGVALASAVGAVVVAVVVLLVRHVVRNRVAGANQTRSRAGGPVPLPAVDWLQRARAAERSGQWGEVIRCRYRASVDGLREWGLVGEVPGRTSGEYRHDVARGLPAASRPFDDLSTAFESVYYGGCDAGEDEARLSGQLGDRVVALASSSAPGIAGPATAGTDRR